MSVVSQFTHIGHLTTALRLHSKDQSRSSNRHDHSRCSWGQVALNVQLVSHRWTYKDVRQMLAIPRITTGLTVGHISIWLFFSCRHYSTIIFPSHGD